MAVLCGLFALNAPPALAGGGPENVLLVVNRDSQDSLTIANHYQQLRGIPAGNMLTLPWPPKQQTTDVETFRTKILLPVLSVLKRRRLDKQIDYVVYSADFPWGIELGKDIEKFRAELTKVGESDSDRPAVSRSWPKQLTPTGSLNGLTYLWQPVLMRSAAYMQLSSNHYMRRPVAQQRDAPSLAFSHAMLFGRHGESVETAGRGYMLSTVLGVTAGRGNTVDEVLRYLRRSAAADGTHPKGTVYYMKNDNVRSKARDRGFAGAAAKLEKLGVAAEVLSGTVPKGKNDVVGAMIGTASFDWKASGSTILPGAICEHFTSFGGIMRANASQTPLSEFLRYGAAGASGTVREPYAIAQKFPDPLVQVHYACGCTLAEAFYQSVHGPYQLLIVGDPLCRPWANIPVVEVEGARSGATVSGKLELRPSATCPRGSSVERFELFVDGLRWADCRSGETLELDSARLGDGYHELRIVAIEAGPIASQGRQVLAVTMANHDRRITATVSPSGTVAAGGKLAVRVSSPGSDGIAVLHNSRLLGRVAGEQGRVDVDTSTLGTGPVLLRCVGLGKGGPLDYAWARPIEVTVK